MEPLRQYQAADKLREIAQLSAFSIPEAKRTKLNGYATLYEFEDGSFLRIRAYSGRADCWHPGWRGQNFDTHLGPERGVPIRVNV